MPLKPSCQEYIGRELFVLPYYGYGWTDLRGQCSNVVDDIGPEPFQMEVKALVDYQSDFVGATGIVEQPGHPFHRYWSACLLRTIDEIDFTQKPGDYLIWLAEQELSILPSPDKALYEWVSGGDSVTGLVGYGTVAETKDQVQNVFQQVVETRRRKKGM